MLTTKIVPNVGHALFPKTDFMRLSKNVNRFGTQMPKASIAMMRSRSNLDYKHHTHTHTHTANCTLFS